MDCVMQLCIMYWNCEFSEFAPRASVLFMRKRDFARCACQRYINDTVSLKMFTRTHESYICTRIKTSVGDWRYWTWMSLDYIHCSVIYLTRTLFRDPKSKRRNDNHINRDSNENRLGKANYLYCNECRIKSYRCCFAFCCVPVRN